MIIFIYGQDSYRSRQKLEEIIEQYKKVHKAGLSFKFYEGNDFYFKDFKEEFFQSSLFKEKKLVVLKEVFKNLFFKENFLKNDKIFSKSENIILFYEKDKIDPKNDLFKFLKKEAKCQEFELLDGAKLKNWIKKEFEKYKTEVDPKAIETLVFYIGNDLWQMANEVKKLVNFKNGKKVAFDDLRLLVKPKKIELDIFKTIDALSQKNKKTAIFLIHKHLENGDNPFYLLSMITYQFRNLLIVKNLIEKRLPYYDYQKITKLSSFVIKKSYEQSQRFSFAEIKKIYQKIFKADLDIKTGKIEPEAALDLLIAEI